MTDLGETSVQPEFIATHYLTSVDDVAEHLKAANQLGLGVRVRSYVEPSEDGEELIEGWEVELLTSSPLHEGETEEPEETTAAE